MSMYGKHKNCKSFSPWSHFENKCVSAFLILALVEHQHQRLNELSQDLGRTYIELDRLKRQVSTMEQDLLEKRRKKADTFPSAKDVQKMREDNRRMTIDIHLMTREIDGFSRGGQSKRYLNQIFEFSNILICGNLLTTFMRSFSCYLIFCFILNQVFSRTKRNILRGYI